MAFSGSGPEANLLVTPIKQVIVIDRQYYTGPIKKRIGGVAHEGVAHQILIRFELNRQFIFIG